MPLRGDDEDEDDDEDDDCDDVDGDDADCDDDDEEEKAIRRVRGLLNAFSESPRMSLGSFLEASWDIPGSSWRSRGPLRGLLGVSWGPLGASWAFLGASYGGELGFSVRVPSLGPLLVPFLGILGAS